MSFAGRFLDWSTSLSAHREVIPHLLAVPGELLLTRRRTGPKHEKQGVTARPQVTAN